MTPMPSTTTYSPGEIVLVLFPFVSGGQAKKRAAVVLVDNGDADILVARVTSKPPRLSPYEVVVADWKGAGLQLPSVVRLHKMATLEKTEIVRPLGFLRPLDRQQVSMVLNKMFANW